MTKLIQNINIPKYDSMSLLIPFNQCNIIDDRLTQQYLKVYPTMENYTTGELHEAKPVSIIKNGITIRIGFKETTLFDNKKEQKTPIRIRNIRVTLPAKLLKEKYFEGINSSNIKLLYNEFIKFNIFSCSYQTFMNSLPTDIDICKDIYTNSKIEFISTLKSIIAQSENNKSYLKLFNESQNIGLVFNKRELAIPTKPHYKIYSKQFDLETKSKEFADNYLTKFNTKNLIRAEATIKNSAHKKRLAKKLIFPEFKTLEQLLAISDKYKNQLLEHSLNCYIMKTIRVPNNNLTPNDQILTEFMEQLILNKYDYKQIIGFSQYITLDNKETERKQIIQTRNKLKYLFDNIIHNNEQLKLKTEENKGVQNLLKWLGVKN